jgi:hypothetical protein
MNAKIVQILNVLSVIMDIFIVKIISVKNAYGTALSVITTRNVKNAIKAFT